MFCFGGCKLYPSVPKQEGLEAPIEVLNSRSKSITPKDDSSILATKLYININEWAEFTLVHA